MAGKIIMTEGVAPATPVGTGKHSLYIDNADSKFKKKNTSGVVDVVATESVVIGLLPSKASQVEMQTGTDDIKYITPLQLKQSRDYNLLYTDNTTSQNNTASPLSTGGTAILFSRPQNISIYMYAYNSGGGSSYAGFQYSLNGTTGRTDIYGITTTNTSPINTTKTYQVKGGLYIRGLCSGQFTGNSNVVISYQ